jgi:hypothetical protein
MLMTVASEALPLPGTVLLNRDRDVTMGMLLTVAQLEQHHRLAECCFVGTDGSIGTFSVETALADQRTMRYVTPWETVC